MQKYNIKHTLLSLVVWLQVKYQQSGMNTNLCGRTLVQKTFLLAQAITTVHTDMRNSPSGSAKICEKPRFTTRKFEISPNRHSADASFHFQQRSKLQDRKMHHKVLCTVADMY